MSNQVQEDITDKVSDLLPSAISVTLESYEAFLSEVPAEDIKAFSAYHSAAKSALSHLEQLLKIQKLLPSHGGEDLKELEKLIEAAEADFQNYLRQHEE